MVPSSVAINSRVQRVPDPGRKQVGVRSRQIRAILDSFFYLSHPQFM